ncbi:zinc finger protein 184-like [Hyposmocoma kahamanoa]|uniref:zinc finger protein 184-like n=1 Tax=Hyposmocoma kahamanoa TaxID=1477025 RepID=UPI000E6D8BAC|nr:zinc finger protein 184-like [Hyposmocoma kahamanoa]
MYEGSLCVCCMSTDDLLGLFEVRKVNNFEENYAKILNSCLNVQLSPQDGHDSICAVCVASLKQCVTFKKQILRSISVILSIDLSQILSEEDVAVLGLLQSEKDIITKSQINVNQEIINNNCDGLHSKKCEAPSPPSSPKTTNKHKRPVGRPRTHPKDNIPYEINREERNCRECGVQFLNYFSLKKHYNTHFRNHICTVCKKGFMTRISLMKHQKTHQKGPFSCDICHTQFRTLNSVQSHKHFKHTARSRRLPPNEPLPCPYCDRVFTWSGDRNRHIQNQHEIRMYPCPNCGIKLKKTSLRSHLFQRHNIGTGYKCAVCDAMRVTRAALARHMDSHLDIRR